MPEASPGSIGASAPDEQRGEKRADEMHAGGRTIALGRLLEEPPDLRTGEPLERTRARAPREHIWSRRHVAVISAHSSAVLESIQIGDSSRANTLRI